jgi:hypothetical protein
MKQGKLLRFNQLICGAAPSQPIQTIIGTADNLTNIINHAEFHFDRWRGFGLAGIQVFLLESMADLNTVLRAAALARDGSHIIWHHPSAAYTCGRFLLAWRQQLMSHHIS